MATFKNLLKEKVHNSSMLVNTMFYKSFLLPSMVSKYENDLETFAIRDSDIWLCGYPKTGTTWCQEMIWCICNDLDYERAQISIAERFPFFDFSLYFNDREEADEAAKIRGERTIESISNETGQRFIKTHLPFNLLPYALRERKTKAKIVYVMRNPKDVCISAYHYSSYALGYDDTFENFCHLFLNDGYVYAPIWKHVLGYWNAKDTYGDHIMIVKYREMKENLPKVIQKMAKFLEKPLLSPEQTARLTEHLSFDKIKANPAVNHKGRIEVYNEVFKLKKDGNFIRCGKVDQWKKEMSPEIIRKFDEKTVKMFASTDVTF